MALLLFAKAKELQTTIIFKIWCLRLERASLSDLIRQRCI